MTPDDVAGVVGSDTETQTRPERGDSLAGTLLQAERLILERVARGAPLADVLELLCAAFERHADGMCTTLRARVGRLYVAATGSVPPAFASALAQGVDIGPTGGACGAAAHRRERVICRDIATDACFVPAHRDLARAFGIVAMWSTPILSSSGQLLGTFAVYERTQRVPDAEEIELIDRLVYIASIAIDREQVLAELRDSEEQHRRVVSQLDEVIFHTDRAQRLVFVNAAVTRVIGHTVEEVLGRPLLGLVHPDDRALISMRLRSLLDRERDSDEGELRLLAREGGHRWVRFRARPLVDAGGLATGLSGSLSDVTERKKLEAQLLVSDRMASMGTLVAGVAHEINNPLASMMLNLDYVSRELGWFVERVDRDGKDRIDRLLEPLRAVGEGAERVRDIVKNLKIFSRGEERRRPVEIQPILESTMRMAANEIRHRARVLKSYGRVPIVEANEASLGQVFLNLIVNAAHAIPEGDAERNQLEVRTFSDDAGQAIIEISDTGAGIAPQHLGRIFEPFFTTKPVGVGTGLGLSICHRLVTGLGGSISVESQLGVGSTFRVTLPASTRRPTLKKTPSQPFPVYRRGAILVIDDDPIVGAAVRRLLASLHDVVHLTSGEEALARLEAGERYDVILCDIMMPRMTGMQVHDEIRRRWPDLAARIVFITGGAFTPRAKTFLENVPNLVLDKPFELKVLVAAIHELLRVEPPGAG